MRRLPPPLLLIASMLLMPGCIVQDIHDQIALTNAKLDQIDESFAKVQRANELLAELDTKLAALDSINANLGRVDTTLGTVEADLKAVSESLASLRATINNIDSTIPFLKFSGDAEGDETVETDAVPEPAEAPAEDPSK
jgi:prefoldin subunit 5